MYIQTAQTLTGGVPDRRKRRRLVAQWPLQIWSLDEYLLDTSTTNASSSGFYFLSPRSLSPGDSLLALLSMPGVAAHSDCQNLVLRCEVLVMRVERSANDFGIACQIIDYSVLASGL